MSTEFKTKNGLTLELKPVKPMFLQQIIRSVPEPEKPVYETVTASGRVELLPMDEQSAKETPNGEARWAKFQEDTDKYSLAINERVTLALFVKGIRVKGDIDFSEWEEEMVMFGLEIPEDPRMKIALYLQAELEVSEIVELTQKLMELSSLSEEAIAKAEDSFRGKVSGKTT